MDKLNEEVSIREMRRVLIYFTIRNYPRLSPHKIYSDIKDYEKMEEEKLRKFYNAWFTTEVKGRNT